MFTWICPQCGREVPPSYTECPDCVAKQAAASETAPPPAAAPAVAAPPPPAPAMAAPPTYQPAYAAPVAAPAARTGLPTWLMSILFALAFIGLGAGVYFAVQHFQGGGQAPATASAPQAAPLQNLPAAGMAASTNPLQKYIEVTGVRFLADAKKQTEVHFVVVNHSGAEVADLGANVAIYGRTQKEGEEAVGRFSFKVPSLGPYESKDVVAPLDSKLKAYELPDWQNVVTQVQVTGQ